jgi:hypothetical protein
VYAVRGPLQLTVEAYQRTHDLVSSATARAALKVKIGRVYVSAGDAQARMVLTANGTPDTFTYSASGLPPGLEFEESVDEGVICGAILGVPTQAGAFPVTLTVSNDTAPDATQKFTLTLPTRGAPSICH